MFEDNLINKIFEKSNKEVTVIYGAAGTGKTTFAKAAAINLAKEGKKILYLDSENGFSTERFKQLAGEDYKKLLENIFIFKIKSFKEQQKRINEIGKFKNVDLIVLDSAGIHYRTLVKRHSELANAMLNSQLRILNKVSKEIPVIITNQVYKDIDNNCIRMVGQNIVMKWCDRLICLEDKPRKLRLLKPNRENFYFDIVEEGIIGKF